MKKSIITILAVFIIPALAYLGLSQSGSSTAKDASGKPEVIKFTSAMCLDCQKMNKIFTALKPKYGDRIAFTDVNVQDNSDFAKSQIKKHNITLVPTIILFDSSGKQIKRIEDAIPETEMDNYLKGLK
ncbi:MAG: thioredoxin family protein [Heliobacteriaceae bacterium]|jgi:thiol-disulfide isomerase/thioredoxin|nr:thioredoxin family protein [Heliobacteriaceae bacterium]